MTNVRRCALGLLVLLMCGLATAQTHVELILDASGSMWNKLEGGEYRIVAAKEVLSDFVSSLPADPELNVGLRVYGSRISALDEGACEDSELFVPVDGIAREELLGTVQDAQATGATPIAYSLQQAAQDLPETGERVIILVTDGEESCGGDVRGTLEALRAEGIAFELKVIGFDLDDRAVKSFEGLGTFENARSAEELAAALGRAVPVEETASYPVTVIVTRGGEPAEDGAAVTFTDAVSGERFTLTPTKPGTLSAELPAGAYDASVEDALADAPLNVSGLSVTPEGDNRFSFELVEEAEIALSVTPADPVAGSVVTVSFEGAPVNGRDNYITVVPADAPEDVYFRYTYVDAASGQVEVQVPDEAQMLEARYHLDLPDGGSRVIGRSEPFSSTEATATIDAPAEVAAGATFEVSWTGPDNKDDYLTVVPAGAAEGSYTSYFYTKSGASGQLRAGLEPGDYELRYVTGQTQVTLASAPLTVVAAEASLQGPTEVAAGATFQVSWSGPDNADNFITIVPAGTPEGAYTDYFYTREGSSGELTAPIEPGAYELRYLSEQSGYPTLASVPITVTAVSANLDAPAELMAGSMLSVTWQGPNNKDDFVTIVPAGTSEGEYSSYFYTRDGSSGQLKTPIEPGDYEIRYLSGQSGYPSLANRSITLTPIEISLDVPAEVAAGELFEVGWSGPDGSSFYLTIVPVGAAEGEYLDYSYVQSSNPLQLRAPAESGSYEVRFQTDADGVFGSTPVTVK